MGCRHRISHEHVKSKEPTLDVYAMGMRMKSEMANDSTVQESGGVRVTLVHAPNVEIVQFLVIWWLILLPCTIESCFFNIPRQGYVS